MNDDKKLPKIKHNLIMEERKKISVNGVNHIESFDEEEIIAKTELGLLSIKGENLHLNKIDVEDGELSVEGNIDSINYSDNYAEKGSFFSRLLR